MDGEATAVTYVPVGTVSHAQGHQAGKKQMPLHNMAVTDHHFGSVELRMTNCLLKVEKEG
jgi:hypothetical protein